MERFLEGRGPTVQPMGLAIVDVRAAPKPVVRLLSLFDEPIRTILPRLDHTDRLSNAHGALGLRMQPMTPQAAVTAASEWLVSHATARG